MWVWDTEYEMWRHVLTQTFWTHFRWVLRRSSNLEAGCRTHLNWQRGCDITRAAPFQIIHSISLKPHLRKEKFTKILCVPGWPPTWFISEDDLNLVILLFLPLESGIMLCAAGMKVQDGDWIHGFLPSRQALCLLNYVPSPKVFLLWYSWKA